MSENKDFARYKIVRGGRRWKLVFFVEEFFTIKKDWIVIACCQTENEALDFISKWTEKKGLNGHYLIEKSMF